MTRPSIEFGTAAYWRAYADGLISEAQVEADQAADERREQVGASRLEASRRGRSNQIAGLKAAARGRKPKRDLPSPEIHSAWCSLGDHIISDTRLAPSDLRILAKLLQLGRNGRYVETTGNGLADWLGLSREWIRRRLIALEEFGYIASRTLKIRKFNGWSWFAGQIIELAALAFPGGKLPQPTEDDLTTRELIEWHLRKLRNVIAALDLANFRRFASSNSNSHFKTHPSVNRNFSPWKAEKIPRSGLPF